MADKIRLLPEVVANQIAAGEVVEARTVITAYYKNYDDVSN